MATAVGRAAGSKTAWRSWAAAPGQHDSGGQAGEERRRKTRDEHGHRWGKADCGGARPGRSRTAAPSRHGWRLATVTVAGWHAPPPSEPCPALDPDPRERAEAESRRGGDGGRKAGRREGERRRRGTGERERAAGTGSRRGGGVRVRGAGRGAREGLFAKVTGGTALAIFSSSH